MVRACKVLDDAAADVGVNFLGGFGALVEKGMTPGEKNLIEALPEALATTERICSSINVGSTKAGINMDAVALMGKTVKAVAEATGRARRPRAPPSSSCSATFRRTSLSWRAPISASVNPMW